MDYRPPEIVWHNSYPQTNSIVVKFVRSVTSRHWPNTGGPRSWQPSGSKPESAKRRVPKY